MTLSFRAFGRWPRVRCAMDELPGLAGRLQHCATVDHSRPRGWSLRAGQTLWVAELDGRHAGLCWEWGEVRPGVVALADPMRLRSNIELVDAQGQVVDEGLRVLHLNSLVYRLDWQAAIPGRGLAVGERMAA